MDAAQPLIHVKDFRMKFGLKKVIDGLSFDVAREEIFGFLGSNGSGKTTTIRALLDLSDKADVRVDKLSGNEQQKGQLGVTIMNDPELLILDEPTKGFDPVNRRLPTAKDASTVFAPVMIMMFIPFYIATMVVSDPGSMIVQIFTFFPFTAPVTATLRNAFGSLPGWQAAIVIAELFLFGALALRLAAYLFRYGSIEYSRKLSLRTAFARKG